MTKFSGFFQLLAWALVPFATALLVLGACAPVAPSMNKDTFFPRGPGGAIPHSPVSGEGARTALAGKDSMQGWSDQHVVVPPQQLAEFRNSGWTEISLSDAAPRRIVFELDLSRAQIQQMGLAAYSAAFRAKNDGDEGWVIQEDPSVNSGTRSIVRQHLTRIVLDFGIAGESGGSSATQSEVTDDEIAENENSETELDAGIGKEVGVNQ